MQEVRKATTAPTPVQRQEELLMNELIYYALESEYSFALWRLPNTLTKNLILSYSPTLLNINDSIEELPEGFLVAPFDTQKHRQFLKADLSFSFAHGVLAEPSSPLQYTSIQWLQQIDSSLSTKKKTSFHFPDSPQKEITIKRELYTDFVAHCVHEIEQGTFEKIVPSREKRVDLPDSFDGIESFQKLCIAYPNAMVSLISIPKIGTWLGATPELLVSVEDKTIFKTVALAGTKIAEEGVDLKQVAWTQKEIEEQALVSRYIINNFKKIRLREFEEHGPKTIVAGNLLHLKTEFSVDMKATNFPQLGSVMLNLLHPTSAVCGMPLETSLAFLNQHEGYDREFYSGYIGPVNINSNSYLFVNLRCMQLLEKQAIVYAGAGVTIDSVPESEWNETEMKLNTLLNVIL